VDELWNVWEEGAKLLKSACSQEQDEDHSFGSFLNVTVYTWNAAGLFCNDIFKMKAKLDYVGSWLCKGTVIAFQETHDDGDAATHNFESLYSDTFIFVRSALTRAAGGVMLAIKKSYVDRFCSKEEYVLIDGRMVAITLRHSHFNVCFICVHLQATPNDPDHKILMLKTLLDFVRGVTDCYVFICGDFNFITDSCDRTDLTTGMSVGRLCKVGKFWNEHFYSFDELHQQSHTRFPTEAIDAGSSARLDRIYCNAPLEAFALWDVHVSTLGILHNAYISDHIPVVARIGLRDTPRPCPNIPHFVTREAVFNNEVDRLMDKHSFAKCCWARVAETKDIFYSAFDHYKNHQRCRGALLAKERIFHATEALRANATLNLEAFLKALESAPQLQHESFTGGVPVEIVHVEHIRNVLQEALTVDDDDRRTELERIADLPEYDQQRMKKCVMKQLSRHNPKRRKLGIEAVRGHDGIPILEKDKAFKHLSEYWGQKFEEKPINEIEARQFTKKFSRQFPRVPWKLTFVAFVNIVLACRKSAPGPDGVPYSAWASNVRAQVILYSAYIVWLSTGYVPIFFNVAYLWLLPKSDPPDGVFNPCDTRPLSGANGDAKIFAMAIASCINQVIADWAHEFQRGFIHGRCMIQNVLELETNALARAYVKSNSSALMLFDFAAAFPSVARAFIWIALEAIGLPAEVIQAIKALYVNNLHFVKGSFGLQFAFVAFSGVRQGCPLSSVLFVLVTDCIFTALSQSTGPRDFLRGYADDIGMIIRNLWESGPEISQMFLRIGRISRLELNGKKCILIPLWSVPVEENIRARLAEIIPDWSIFSIKPFGKYLGFLIGPGAKNQEWNHIMTRVLDIAHFIKSLGLPKLHSLMLYNMVGVSQLRFVAQLRVPPRALRRFEISAARAVIGGPGLWAPMDLFYNLRSKCAFPIAVPAFDTVCATALLTTAINMKNSWQWSIQVLRDSSMEDDACPLHPMSDWLQGCAAFSLRDVHNTKCDLALSAVPSLSSTSMHFQKGLYAELLARMHPIDLTEILTKKFSKWATEEDAVTMAVSAEQMLQTIHGHIPPCVLFTLICTWCNGWATNRRFQGSGQCLLHADCHGEDALEHYAVCPYQWNVFQSRLKKEVHSLSIASFLGFAAAQIEDMIFHACHIYAVKRAIDIRRHTPGNARSISGQVDGLIWNGHRTAALYHNGLARRYRQLGH
jgi:exonuclease III